MNTLKMLGIILSALIGLNSAADATTITATWEGIADGAFGSSQTLGTPQNGDAVEIKFTYDSSQFGNFAYDIDPFNAHVQYGRSPFAPPGAPLMYSAVTVSLNGGPVYSMPLS